LEPDVSRPYLSPRAAIAALVLFTSALAPPLERADAQKEEKKSIPPASELVKLALVADTTHVRAGKKLTLAARFDIAPGWHIYWENPGEAGLATEAEFTAPAGYEVGPLRYPGPVRFQTPGENAASFGYTEQAVLSSAVAPPARIADKPARFSVQASWLACRDVCIRGQARATLEVPPAARGQAARAANKELFERHRAELPRPASELRATSRWQRDDKGARLLVGIRRADRVEYFPPSGEDLQLVGQESSPGKGATELRLAYKTGFKPARARGVVAVTTGKERRYYALNLEESP
jgi:thiol:disulfide interchange protein DsbD